jgi:putative transposase
LPLAYINTPLWMIAPDSGVLGLYKKRTASNTLLFLERLIEQMPFSIQRIQTDRGKEFFAYKVQEKLME